jgi:hypothetical protein
METLELIPFLALLIGLAAWISAPVRRGSGATQEPGSDLAALEAERDLRLAAVREAELERETGKISDEDHRELDVRLRAEAAAALRALEAAKKDGARA